MILNQRWLTRIPDLEEGATFLRKWGLVGVLIGAGTGLGALCLIWLIQFLRSNVAYPDEDLFSILKRFAANDVGSLPVVTRARPECPIGLVTRSALWRAIESAKAQREGRATSDDEENSKHQSA